MSGDVFVMSGIYGSTEDVLSVVSVTSVIICQNLITNYILKTLINIFMTPINKTPVNINVGTVSHCSM